MSLDELLIESQRDLIDAQREHIRALSEALQECADDLKQEVRHRWCTQPDGTCHPALQPKFDRDMVPVNKAYTALAKAGGEQ